MPLDSAPTGILLQYGVAGVFILFLLGALWTLWKKCERLEQEKTALLEARRQDAKDNLDTVVKPMAGISQTLDLIETKLLVSKGLR